MKDDTKKLSLLCSHHSQCRHICSKACDLHGVRLQVSLSHHSVRLALLAVVLLAHPWLLVVHISLCSSRGPCTAVRCWQKLCTPWSTRSIRCSSQGTP